jgi:F0F1-type ATP synthase assembly protein I
VPPGALRVGNYLTIPLLLALVPTVSALLGWRLDRAIGTFPWLTIILLVLGFIGAARELAQTLRRPSGNDDGS